MNIKIKFREGFRPFAPCVLRERVSDYFELDCDSPYMLLVAPVKKERQIPMTDEQREPLGHRQAQRAALRHPGRHARRLLGARADGDRGDQPDYYDLIQEFETLTGCAVLVNTSFNVRGEPIVCTPAGRLPLLHAHPYRPWCSGRTCWTRRRSPSGRRGRLATGVPARLTAAPRAGTSRFTVGAAFLVLAACLVARQPTPTPPRPRGPGRRSGLAGLLVPARLGPVYRAWMGLALRISKVTTPIFMGVTYFW